MRNRWTRTRIDYHPCITSEPISQVCFVGAKVPCSYTLTGQKEDYALAFNLRGCKIEELRYEIWNEI